MDPIQTQRSDEDLGSHQPRTHEPESWHDGLHLLFPTFWQLINKAGGNHHLVDKGHTMISELEDPVVHDRTDHRSLIKSNIGE